MKQKYFLVTGQFALILALAGFFVNSFYLGTNAVLAFAIGVFFGLSLVMNLAYLLTRNQKKAFNQNSGSC